MNLKEFIDPPKKNRPLAHWAWNSDMEPAEIDTQARELKRKGFGGFIIHAAPGLKTTYLGDDWLKAVRRAVEIANELKMEAWLHDEDQSPSGYAGGAITTENRDFAPTALVWEPDAASVEKKHIESGLVYTRPAEDGAHELLSEIPDSLDGVGVFYVKTFTAHDPRFNNSTYTDLLNPDAVQAFLAATHEKYLDRFRYEFGEFLPGFVTESPTPGRTGLVQNAADGSVLFPWTAGFADYFETLHGYSPLDKLHHLLGGEDGFKFRHDFHIAVTERFIETYMAPVADWCHEHDLSLTGQFSAADGLSGSGPLMAVAEQVTIPGVVHSGRDTVNLSAVKEAASLANQLGKKRVQGTIFGDACSNYSFEDMKCEADLQAALGVTSLEPKTVPYSTLGTRKSDSGPVISYHQPYWERFQVLGDYLSRCSWAVSQGQSTASVLVLAPYSAASGLYNPMEPDGGNSIKTLTESYEALICELIAEHIGFDICDERILSRHGSVSGDVLTVGNARYSCVVVPPSQSWRTSTLELLDRFSGQVIVMGEPAGRVNGSTGDQFKTFCGRDTVKVIADDPAAAVQEVCGVTARQVSVKDTDGAEARNIVVNHRRDGAAHVVFLANTDRADGIDVTVTVGALGGVVELDPVTGLAYRYQADTADSSTVIKTSLYPAGSRIFLVDQTQTSITERPAPAPSEEALTVAGPYAFKALHDNSLTLDRCKLEIDGDVLLENGTVRKAREIVWEKTGLTEFNDVQPWVLKDRNIRSRTNQTILTYTFEVEEIPESIALAMETSDRFTIQINGETIDFSPGRWFIDRRCRVLNLEDHVAVGTNTITATTDYLWDTEISSPHIFGNFSVVPVSDGFTIRKAPETLDTGDWCGQGYPFYAGTMSYVMDFSIEMEDGVRYELDIAGAKGSVFSVTVNDKTVGVIPFAPYRGDITEALKSGDNTVEIEVAGSLKNAYSPRGSESDDKYAFTPYGLMSAPKLVKVRL